MTAHWPLHYGVLTLCFSAPCRNVLLTYITYLLTVKFCSAFLPSVSRNKSADFLMRAENDGTLSINELDAGSLQLWPKLDRLDST